MSTNILLRAAVLLFSLSLISAFKPRCSLKVTRLSSSVLNEPTLQINGLPQFKQIDESLISSVIVNNLEQLKKDFSDFEKSLKNPQMGESWGTRRIEYDYPTVIEKLEKIQAPLAYSWGVINHLMGVRNSDGLRKVHETIQEEVVKVYQTIGQSQPLFTALSALKKRHSVWGKQHLIKTI